MLSLNKIGEEGKTDSAWKQGEWGERERMGGKGERRCPKQCMHI
jgi:hypothetical protein